VVPLVRVVKPIEMNLTTEFALGTTFEFHARWPEGSSTSLQGIEVEVTLVDVVKNSAVISRVLPFESVNRGPTEPSASNLVFQRAPWGTADAGPSFSVEITNPSAIEHLSYRILSAAQSNASEIAKVVASTAAIQRVELPVFDRETVWVTAIDEACNESVPVEVKTIEWIATSGKKRDGSTLENPHEFELVDD
jgi:hypothetical protein